MHPGLLILYGINSCDTCRKAKKWLEAQSYEYRFHDLRDDGLDAETLNRWVGRIDWQKLLNTRSLTWRKMPEVDRADMSEDTALASMLENPTTNQIAQQGDRRVLVNMGLQIVVQSFHGVRC